MAYCTHKTHKQKESHLFARTGLLIALALAAMLVIACSSSKPEMLPVDSAPICKEMSKEGAQRNADLKQAAHSNCASVAQQLLADGYGTEMSRREGKGAFFAAIRNNSADAAKVLIDHWQDTNELSKIINKPLVSGHRDHPLHIAAGTYSRAWRESLGEDVGRPDSSRGALEVAKLLIDHGADVNGKNRELDQTPLHVLASNRGDAVELAKLLIESGANINAQSHQGRGGARGMTPLHEVVAAAKEQGQHLELTKLLINNGAAINAKTAGGQTPLSMTQHSNAVDIAKLLIENGANTTGIDLSWMENQ